MSDQIEMCHAAALEAAGGRPVIIEETHGGELTRRLGPRSRDGAVCMVMLDSARGRVLQRVPVRSEGLKPRWALLSGDIGRKAAMMATRGAALLDREDAVRGGDRPDSPYPAWSFAMHPVALRMLRITLLDPDRWTRPSRGSITGKPDRTDAWERSRGPSGAVLKPLEPNGAGSWYQAQACGSRIEAQVLRTLIGRGPAVMEYLEKDGGCSLRIPARLPSTATIGMRDVALGRLVDWDWGDADDAVVTGAEEAEGGTLLHLAPALTPVDPFLEEVAHGIVMAAA
jgi:hypothetical protein